MLRIVRTEDGSVMVDQRGRMNGRGCYICLDAAKFDERRISDKIRRALKLGKELPAGFIEELSVRMGSG